MLSDGCPQAMLNILCPRDMAKPEKAHQFSDSCSSDTWRAKGANSRGRPTRPGSNSCNPDQILWYLCISLRQSLSDV